MRIAMRYFAAAAEIAGSDGEPLELPDGATAGDALAAAAVRHPRLRAAGFRLVLAVNRRHAQADVVLAEGDEVAVFPPVSGG